MSLARTSAPELYLGQGFGTQALVALDGLRASDALAVGVVDPYS